MNVTTLERLLLLNLLPADGDIVTLRIVRALRSDLSFSEAEIAALKLTQIDGRIEWDRTHDTPKEVEIGPKATELIASALKQASEQKLLTDQHVPLWDTFVGDGQ